MKSLESGKEEQTTISRTEPKRKISKREPIHANTDPVLYYREIPLLALITVGSKDTTHDLTPFTQWLGLDDLSKTEWTMVP